VDLLDRAAAFEVCERAGDAEDAVEASDATVFPVGTRALYVGGAGDVVVRKAQGNTVAFAAVPAGTLLPIVCDQVRAASTATNIVALL
jgi:hypothetical protein